MQLKTRSVMLEELSQQIYTWTYAEHDRPYFHTFYMEQGTLYGLFNGKGMLFRATVDVDADGQTLVLGELEPVIHQFTPVERSGFTVIRQADGQHRFFCIAATAILNRVGEIDSTLLFDDMIQRAEQFDYYPKLDFWHLGEYDPIFEFGQFDFLAREGVTYVGSGLLDPTNPLSACMIRAVAEEPGEWGASIEYYRPQNRGMEFVDLSGGVSIVAYTEGLNTRISFLPESAAAAFLTDFTVEKREMNDKKKKALRELFGNDGDYEAFLAKLTGVNTEVEKRGLISRSTDGGSTTEPTAETTPAAGTTSTETAPAGEAQQPVVELDDTAIQAIVGVARGQFEEVFRGIGESLTTLLTKVEALEKGFTSTNATVNGMQERLNALSADDETKQREWKADLPTHLRTATRITYRPSKDAESVPAAEPTVEEQAASVLNKLPKVGIN